MKKSQAVTVGARINAELQQAEVTRYFATIREGKVVFKEEVRAGRFEDVDVETVAQAVAGKVNIKALLGA